uniref:Glycerol-3-phosphate dehydrogenase [NAD(P)+] n=1 Tax=Candidatus Kentrum sp. TUN TaxID=2126343 RepID=A0A450ZWT3_9GAMM|nr:MAG: glycerol-3-phosphate dehydrogenase (NAD(P)+) [Candidatus Kentron sp. TUN]VFK59796.1 MAG: glycerol-3-phosphate dehydrogenase (NAD(P)+) [Candidatus Kentron sp. TUN]VFK67263.1 MAG: glycerol-3-phosphate dehydrogenase (NAD(P)+) [Candidatus Kentron sp. TUN]
MRSTKIPNTHPIAVLGAGAWGTALAILLARNGKSTILWSWETDHAQALREDRQNQRFLPNYPFPSLLSITSNLTDALSHARDVLIAVPSYAFREVLESSALTFTSNSRIVWATKGFEPGTGRLLHQVAADIVGPDTPMAVLSGPTFAAEVAGGLPTAVTIASTNDPFAQDLSMFLHSQRFRVYTSRDIIGVQIGGAVKNILAIAAGTADGFGFGANARAALITRGLAELVRFGVEFGGERETFMGFAGLGDLVLTCTDDQSRNRRFGLALAEGKSPEEAKRSIGQVIEGINSTRVVVSLARRRDIEMPITEQVHRVLFEHIPPLDAVNTLLARSARPENL